MHRISLSRWVFILQSSVGVDNRIENVYTHRVQSARVLRLLATNYIFVEISPDVFANNRLSTVLDTGKPVEELISK
jgi:hypothetical protein